MIHTKRISEMIRYFFIIIYMILVFYVVLDVGGSYGLATFFIVPLKSYIVIPLLILGFLIPTILASIPLTVMTKNLHVWQLLLYVVITYGSICYIESVVSNSIAEIRFPAVLFLLAQFVLLLFLRRLWKNLGQNVRRSVLILSLVFLFSLWGYLWAGHNFDTKELVVSHIVKFLKIIMGL